MQPILQMRKVEFRVGKVTELGGGPAQAEFSRPSSLPLFPSLRQPAPSSFTD